jgi:hypothetical protein
VYGLGIAVGRERNSFWLKGEEEQLLQAVYIQVKQVVIM